MVKFALTAKILVEVAFVEVESVVTKFVVVMFVAVNAPTEISFEIIVETGASIEPMVSAIRFVVVAFFTTKSVPIIFCAERSPVTPSVPNDAD
mgnify:FL=1